MAMTGTPLGANVCPTCGEAYEPGLAICPRDGTPLTGWKPPITGDHDLVIGLKLGDFVVEERVAHGGMGIVYRAVQPMIGRKVAVKVLRPEMAANKSQVDRFLAEARAISSITHPGIVDVFSFGTLPDGRQYMVMELLEGEALDVLIFREGPLSLQVSLPLFDDILDALSAAHEAGVVHRDLKPSNVFLARQSNGTRVVKLVDFGLAKQTPLGDVNARTGARASLIAGTPEYISPEQIRGEAPVAQTDLYGFGVVAFEMLTKRLPFQGETVVHTLEMHARDTPPHVKVFRGDIPHGVDDLVFRLMAKRIADRPASAGAARAEVQRLMRELRVDGAEGPRDAPTAPSLPDITSMAAAATAAPPRRSRKIWALAAVPFVAAAGVSVWLKLTESPEEPVVVAQPPPVVAPVPLQPPAPAPAPAPAPVLPAVSPPESDDPSPTGRPERAKRRPYSDWESLGGGDWAAKMAAHLDRDEAKLRRAALGDEPNRNGLNLLKALRARAADAADGSRKERQAVAQSVANWERQFLK